MKLHLLTALLLLSPALAASAQPLIPQDLFDTGVNLGYLEGHSQKGGGESNWPTWAGNTEAEWASAWGSSFSGLYPNPPYPQGAISVRAQYEQYLLTNASGGCRNFWHRNALTLFQAGYYLAKAFVETNYRCPSCLRSDLYSASLAFERMGQSLSAEGSPAAPVMLDVAQVLRSTADEVERTPDAAAATTIQAAFDALNPALPDDPFMCSDAGEESSAASTISCPRRVERTDYVLVVLSTMYENIYYFSLPGRDYLCGYVMNFGRGIGLHRGTHALRPLPEGRGFVHLTKSGGAYVQQAELLIDDPNCGTIQNREGQTRTVLCGDRVRSNGASSRFRLYVN